MKIINSKVHGALDYATVAFLFLSPSLFGMPHLTALVTYIIGAIHLALTVTTNFEFGLFKILPFKIHGIIELIVSIALVGVGFYLGSVDGNLSKYFYWGFAAVVFAVWSLTDYSDRQVNAKI